MLKAFMRLNSSVQKLILVLVLLLGSMLIYALSKLISNPVVDTSGWPESSFDKVYFGQSSKLLTYDELPTRIQFPGTVHSIMINGTPENTSQDGLSVRYGEDALIIAMLGKGEEIKDDIENRFPQLLTGLNSEATYKTYVRDKGYFNGYEAWYEGGILRIVKDEHYILCYRLKTEDGTLIEFAIAAREARFLESMKQLLDKIGYTYGTLQQDAAESQINDAGTSKTSGTVGEPAGKVVIEDNASGQQSTLRDRTEVDAIDEEYDSMTTPEMMDSLDTAQSEAQYNIAYPDRPDYLEDIVDVTDDLSQKACVFCFSFSHSDTVPKECMIISPSGKHLYPDDNNNTRTGYVVFYVDKPEKGRWGLKASTNNQYGTYDFSCSDKDSFIAENRGYPPNAEIWDSQNKDY